MNNNARPDPQAHEPADDWIDSLLRQAGPPMLPIDDDTFSAAVLRALPPPRRTAAALGPRPSRKARAWLNLLSACMLGTVLAVFLWTLPSVAEWWQSLQSASTLPGLGATLEHVLPSLVPLALLCWWSLQQARGDTELGV